MIDQFLDDDLDSCSRTSAEDMKEENLRDDDDEAAFCIMPFAPITLTKRKENPKWYENQICLSIYNQLMICN